MGFDLQSGRTPGGDDYNPGSGSGGDLDLLGWYRSHPQRAAITIVTLLIGCAFIGLATDRDRWFWLFFFLGAFIYLIWSTPAFLRRRQVIDRWDMVIAGGSGQSQLVIEATQEHIDEFDPPNVALERADMAPGLWRGLTGDTRPFLIAQNSTNRRIKSYRMFVNVRDYGEALQTSWYLAYLPTIWQRFRGRLGQDLDLFDEQDLRAYVTVVHQSFIEAVIDLLNTLGQDTNVNRTSKGFLGVS